MFFLDSHFVFGNFRISILLSLDIKEIVSISVVSTQLLVVRYPDSLTPLYYL